MHIRKLIPGIIRKKLIQKRRSRNSHALFKAGLDKLAELSWQYEEWSARWRSNGDPECRRRTKELLQRMYAIIKRLAANNNRRQLQAKIRELKIPGAKRYTK